MPVAEPKRPHLRSCFGASVLQAAAALVAISVPVTLGLLHAKQVHAQTQAAEPATTHREFEVATIKPSDPDKPGGRMGINTDQFETTGQTLKSLIKFAYNLNYGSDQQISGGPDWAASAKFDITAQEDEGTSAALLKVPAEQRMAIIRPMVQTLLAERFNLKVHHESKQLSVYVLVAARGGPKLKPEAVEAGAAPKSWHGIQGQRGNGQLEGRGASMDMFSTVISMQPEIGGRMVVDQTGLTGKYDFMLKWTPETGLGAASPGGDAGAAPTDSGPSLFSALQEELGLKLESTKAPVDTIVIDSVEMPSAN